MSLDLQQMRNQMLQAQSMQQLPPAAIYNPEAIQQLEQPDTTQLDLPDYDSVIKNLLNMIQSLSTQIPESIAVDKGTQGIYHIAQSIHLLAQSASEEGEHVPARLQIRLNSAQLQMENSQKVHQMMLQEADQQHQHQLQIQQQAFEQQQATELQQAKIQQMQQAQPNQQQPQGGNE